MSARDLFFGPDADFSEADERVFAREKLIYNVTADLIVAMEELELTHADVAKRLRCTRSHVSRLLTGRRNMTLASLSDLCQAIAVSLEIRIDAESAGAEVLAESVSCIDFDEDVKRYTIKSIGRSTDRADQLHYGSIHDLDLTERYEHGQWKAANADDFGGRGRVA